MSQAHALYRFYSATGELLYVGITLNPSARWKRHRRDKPWWSEVARITLETHPDRPAVLAAERAAIETEHPQHNVVHNGRRPALDHAWPNCADQMPDDCHAHCVPKTGIQSIYYPYAWAGGVAHYQCARGHRWTCHWPPVTGSGTAFEHLGRPVEQHGPFGGAR